MKKLILAMCICSLCLAFMTGCGNKEARKVEVKK